MKRNRKEKGKKKDVKEGEGNFHMSGGFFSRLPMKNIFLGQARDPNIQKAKKKRCYAFCCTKVLL
jgi:hypothetical protein